MKFHRMVEKESTSCCRERDDILRMFTSLSVSMVTGITLGVAKMKLGAITSPFRNRITSSYLPEVPDTILAVISPLSTMSAWGYSNPAME